MMKLTILEKLLADVIRSDASNEFLDGFSDELFKDSNGRISKRADYLLLQRSFIVEVKAVNTNKAARFNDWLNDKAVRDPWLQRHWWGTVKAECLFEMHPNGELLKREAIDYFYKSSISNWINGAIPQLHNTKNKLQLPMASCGVILLNEKDASIEVEDLTIEIKEHIGRRAPSGERTCMPIDFVLIISETSKDVAAGVSVQSLIVHEDAVEKDLIEWYFMNDFRLRWSSHRGMPIRL